MYPSKQPQVQTNIRIDLEIFDAFVKRLSTHDWHYEYSDDINAYRRGKANTTQLHQVSNSHPLLQDAYDIFAMAAFSAPDRATRDERIAVLREGLRKRLEAKAQAKAPALAPTQQPQPA